MASQSKSNAARANGSKSKGPATPEGKARSSQNALKHGLTAQLNTLPGESEEDFDALLESHMAQYQPVGAVEQDLVQTLATTRWRLRRIPLLEFHILESEIVMSQQDIDKEFSEIADLGRLAYVFRKLADNSKALALLIRYEASLTRTHDRVFKHLTTLQKLRNEPKAAPQKMGTDSSVPTRPPSPEPPNNPRAAWTEQSAPFFAQRHGTPAGMEETLP
jgi:hypothetical protein